MREMTIAEKIHWVEGFVPDFGKLLVEQANLGEEYDLARTQEEKDAILEKAAKKTNLDD